MKVTQDRSREMLRLQANNAARELYDAVDLDGLDQLADQIGAWILDLTMARPGVERANPEQE